MLRIHPISFLVLLFVNLYKCTNFHTALPFPPLDKCTHALVRRFEIVSDASVMAELFWTLQKCCLAYVYSHTETSLGNKSHWHLLIHSLLLMFYSGTLKSAIHLYDQIDKLVEIFRQSWANEKLAFSKTGSYDVCILVNTCDLILYEWAKWLGFRYDFFFFFDYPKNVRNSPDVAYRMWSESVVVGEVSIFFFILSYVCIS